MGDLLEEASNWLQDKRHKHVTRTITYKRGADTVDILATVGRTVFEIDGGYGVVERIESRDYLVRTADLVLAGAAVLPKRGDHVRETQGAEIFVYEVLAPGNEPHYRYSDLYRKTLRVHTKHVETESA